jgi:DNA-binding CsgD family transcriptional regulator
LVGRLTDKELEVINLRYKGLKNKEIAEIKKVSEADISQIISRATKKIGTIQEVLEVLQKIGIIKADIEIELTESGEELLKNWRQGRLGRINRITTDLVKNEELVTAKPKPISDYEGKYVTDLNTEDIPTKIKRISEEINLLKQGVANIRYGAGEAVRLKEARDLHKCIYVV